MLLSYIRMNSDYSSIDNNLIITHYFCIHALCETSHEYSDYSILHMYWITHTGPSTPNKQC